MAEEQSNQQAEEMREHVPYKTCRLCGEMGRAYLTFRVGKVRKYECEACTFKWEERVC